MRNNIFLLLAAFTLLAFASCNDELEQKVSMNVTATAENAKMDDNTLVIEKGRMVTFNISGNPDFITFYSGENGHEYAKRHLTETPIEEIKDANLAFTAFAQYGTVPNSMKVFLSTSFDGLRGKGNRDADSLTIDNTEWIDITASCNLPQKSNDTANVVIPLMDYMGKRLTVAFLYDPAQNAAVQPTWEMRRIRIESESVDGSISTLPASALAFSAFDMYAIPDNAYNSTVAAGTWGLKDKITLRISSSPTGQPINKDWMISQALVINGRQPDAGVGIKTISNNPITSYSHTYEKVGEYTVTFIAKNANFENTSEVIKELKIKVIE